MSRLEQRAPAGIACWIIFCAFCNCVGWGLSACRQLNTTGYAVAFLVAAAVGSILWWRFVAPRRRPLNLGRVRRRFSRSFPRAFLILAIMATLGGVLYAPGNPDGL